jgi:pantothenate kinase type III
VKKPGVDSSPAFSLSYFESTMLLAVDIGNSAIKFGLFDGDILVSKQAVPTDKTVTLGDLRSLGAVNIPENVSAAIASSVVPELEGPVSEFIEQRSGVSPVVVDENFDF